MPTFKAGTIIVFHTTERFVAHPTFATPVARLNHSCLTLCWSRFHLPQKIVRLLNHLQWYHFLSPRYCLCAPKQSWEQKYKGVWLWSLSVGCLSINSTSIAKLCLHLMSSGYNRLVISQYLWFIPLLLFGVFSTRP